MNASPMRTLVATIAGLLLTAGAACAARPTYAVTGTIAGSGAGWDYASFDPAHRRIYVSRGDGVSAFDVGAGTFAAHLADGRSTHEPLVLPGGDTLLVTNGATASVRLVKASDGSLLAEIPTAQRPDAAVYDAASGLAVTFSATGVANLIDPVARRSPGAIDIGGKLEFGAADGEGRVFVNVESANEIAVLDIKARALATRYPLAGCDSPGGLAYAPPAGVLIAACDNGVAKVVDAKTGAVVATLPIGRGPDAVIYDPRRRLAFIPCGRDGVLDVVDVGRGADAGVVQAVRTEVGARTGAVDPVSGDLYLPSANFGPAATAGGRPVMIPGSFHILVVSPNTAR